MTKRTKDFEFLLAMGTGETHPFANTDQHAVPPSSRVRYKQVCSAIHELNERHCGGRRDFVARLADNGRKIVIHRINDGMTQLPTPERVPAAPRRTKPVAPAPAAEPIADKASVESIVEAAIRRMAGAPTGRKWWIVNGANQNHAFLDESAAREYARLIVTPTVFVTHEV